MILRDLPDWQNSAQALVDSIAVLESPVERMELLECVCEGLGPALYPAFLHILNYLERNSTLEARQLIADTLVDCLLSGRLPSGESGAWGSQRPTNTSEFVRIRRLGPIEYLCAWYAQGNANKMLSNQQFQQTLRSLLRLVNTSKRAAQLYAQKLGADAEDPASGSYSRATSAGLTALSDAWSAERPETVLVEIFLEASAPSSLLDKVAKSASDYL